MKIVPLVVGLFSVVTLLADDWPQWRGSNRDGVWGETGTLEIFPPEGLKVSWRAPIGGRISSPIVAQGRVYLTDALEETPRAWERVHCYDEKTGVSLWEHSYEVDYLHNYGFKRDGKTGPYSTPIVEAGKLYALGILGDIVCLDAATGALAWKKKLTKEYELGDFYTAPSLLVEGNLLILVIGGKPDACVIALDKNSGQEAWRALSDRWTYGSPIVITGGGKRQLIVWTPEAVTSLDPATGQTWWRHPVQTLYSDATPVFDGGRLLVSGMMFQLDPDQPTATLLWQRRFSDTSIPLLQNGCVYADKSNGRLVCIDAKSEEQLWETDKVTDRQSGACIHLTLNGDSVLLFTNQGNLIRARLTRQGYTELSRFHLIEPTYTFGGRKVIWAAPSYANRHVFVRSDDELVCASLEAKHEPPCR